MKRRRIRVAGWCLLASAFVACSPPGSVPLTQRFIVEAPVEPSASSPGISWQTVSEWVFDHGSWAPWQTLGRGGEGWGLGLDLQLEAQNVELLRVHLTSPRRQISIEVSWLAAGELHTAEAVCHSSYQLNRCELALHDGAGWQGNISRLEIRSDLAADELVLQDVQLLRRQSDSRWLQLAVSQGVAVDFDGDVRNALLAIPDVPIRKTFDIPEHGRLKLAYGRPSASLGAPVQLRIQTGDQLLFETELLAQDAAGWQEAELDLAQLAGREAELELILESSSPAGFAFWGHPEVVSRPPRRRPPNVVLISIDTLRADRLSLYGYERPTSPRLDAWAQRRGGVVFQSAIAQAPWTLPAHVSMFSGLNPQHHQSNQPNPVRPGLPMLPGILRDAGYVTAAVTGGAFLHPQFGLGQGFDRYRYATVSPDQDKTGAELEEGLEVALSWLEQLADRPFFLFFHTYEVHDPFRPREPYFAQFTDQPPITIQHPARFSDLAGGFEERRRWADLLSQPELADLSPEDVRELVSAAYDSGVAYADAKIGQLLEAFESLEIAGQTIFVVTSDHGELLGEHDVLGHLYLHEENLRVPLIIAAPGQRGAGRIVNDQVRQIDLLPTILELAGLPPPPGLDGQSLVPAMDGAPSGVSREALSYAARWNAGISLRYDNRFQYIYNDTVWQPLAGTEHIVPLASDRAETPLDEPGMARLAQRLRDSFFDALPGVWLQLRNDSTESFEGAFTGWANPYGIKSMNLECACVDYDPPSIRFRAPPGESFSLHLMALRNNLANLRLEVGTGTGSWAGNLTLQQLDDGFAVGRSAEGWSVGAKSDAEIELQWRGSVAQVNAADVDPALRERLQALGYVGVASDP